MGLPQRGGDVMTKVIPDVERPTLLRETGHNARRGSTIHADGLTGYGGVEGSGHAHKAVSHSEGIYAAKDGRGTQGIDGYRSRLKSSIRGTGVHVSGKHLQKHAGEFGYRHNSRREPEKTIDELLSELPRIDEE